jgi:hypothetical protein
MRLFPLRVERFCEPFALSSVFNWKERESACSRTSVFGLKLLWKEKAFTITALLTLALCIGANTAIFTVLHAVILNPLPFPEPGRLVSLYNIYPGAGFHRPRL